MNREVYPITEKDLKRIRGFLIKKDLIVFLAFINIGLNTGLRASDILRLKFENVDESGVFRMKEKKTKKIKLIKFNMICFENIKMLKNFYEKKGIENTGFLFKSLNRVSIKNATGTALSYSGVKKNFNMIKFNLNINYSIGSHSLRKTFGKIIYKKNNDIALVMKLLNHSSSEITLRYIGINDEEIISLYDNLII
ncbi:MAG: tyrosine-type recombinase/integrase [Fusobacteriaceae bacterium]